MCRWRLSRPAPPLALVAVALAWLLAACSTVTGTAAPQAAEDGRSPPPPTIQPDDVVDLTVYLRNGEGQEAHLVPVLREVPIQPDLPRRALELLIAGPAPDETDLEAPLPTTTRVHELSIQDSTAHVDLSDEVVSDADQVGSHPTNEALALAALVDTLTEFPEIDRVRLTIEGRATGEDGDVTPDAVDAFWGGWGLPEVLVRDDSVVAPEGDRTPLPDLDAFAAGSQSVGSPDAQPVAVRGVRLRDRTSYLRVVVELADANDPDEAADIPATRAWAAGDAVVLEVKRVTEVDAEKIRLDAEDPTFAELDATLEGERLRVTVRPSAPREFALQTLASPVRVVLDIRK